MSFSELGLCEPVLRAVEAAGYENPTPIQRQAVPHVAAGRDLLGCAQTGTGKTAAFALPLIHRLTAGGNPPKGRGRRIRALVLSPTRELAAQIGDSFREYGKHTTLKHTVIFGGVSQFHQVRALERGVDVLVATPGRLLDLMDQGYIDLRGIEIFVLDEADRMLDMGFLPDVRRIIGRLPAERQTLLFSATMPGDIRKLADSILRDPVTVKIAPVKATADLIEQSVYFVAQKNKPQLLAHVIATHSIDRLLVFTRTKHGADAVVRKLARVGVRAEAIHGNKSQNARQRALDNFRNNRTQVLVATDIAARGLDVEGISHVVNFDLPMEAETYVHRIGRTGRAGAKGLAISFCDNAERGMLNAIQREIRRNLRLCDDHPVYENPAPAGNANNAGANNASPASANRQSGPRGGNGGNSRGYGRRTDGAPAGGKRKKRFAQSGRRG